MIYYPCVLFFAGACQGCYSLSFVLVAAILFGKAITIKYYNFLHCIYLVKFMKTFT